MSAATAPQVRSCRNCSCTDTQACPGGCYWVSEDLCSACAPPRADTGLPVITGRKVQLGDKHVKVSPGEAAVLKVLLQYAETLVDLDALHMALYQEQRPQAGSNVLQVMMSRLRKKLGCLGGGFEIQTVRARGYRFVVLEGGAA